MNRQNPLIVWEPPARTKNAAADRVQGTFIAAFFLSAVVCAALLSVLPTDPRAPKLTSDSIIQSVEVDDPIDPLKVISNATRSIYIITRNPSSQLLQGLERLASHGLRIRVVTATKLPAMRGIEVAVVGQRDISRDGVLIDGLTWEWL